MAGGLELVDEWADVGRDALVWRAVVIDDLMYWVSGDASRDANWDSKEKKKR